MPLAAGRGLPRAEGVGDVAVLEVAPATTCDAELVADGIAQAAPLPAHAGPLGQDGAVDRPRAGGAGPVDGAVVAEVVVAADLVGCGALVRDWVAEEAALPAQGGPFGPDGAVDGPGPGGRRPVDGSVDVAGVV